MFDEQEPIAEVEAETPIEPEVETDEPQDLNAPETAEVEEQTEPESDPDEEELEWNGKKFKAPKGLKDGVLMHGDYTRKTQEISATKKELEAEKARILQQAQATEEELDARADVRSVTTELKKYENWGWPEYQAMRQQDPLGADEHWNYKQHLETRKAELTSKIEKAAQGRTVQAQQETAKRLQETRRYAETQIKGWTPEIDAKVTTFMKEVGGFDEETLVNAYSPQVYNVAYLAWLGHQTLQKPAAAAKPALPKPAPLTTVASKGNPNARKSLADMSMEEYVAYRKAQDKRG